MGVQVGCMERLWGECEGAWGCQGVVWRECGGAGGGGVLGGVMGVQAGCMKELWGVCSGAWGCHVAARGFHGGLWGAWGGFGVHGGYHWVSWDTHRSWGLLWRVAEESQLLLDTFNSSTQDPLF